MQGGEFGPDGQIIRGTEQPKRNGLQALYGGKPYSPGDEFDMNDRDLKAAGVGEPDSGIELASVHAARMERIAKRENEAAQRAGEKGNWFERLANQQEEQARARALSMKLNSEKAREHIERALGHQGPEAGRHLAHALDAEGDLTAATLRRATELEQRLQDVLEQGRRESAALQERFTQERAAMAEQLARQERVLAELQARAAVTPPAAAEPPAVPKTAVREEAAAAGPAPSVPAAAPPPAAAASHSRRGR
jgi:hypothetical protein